MMSKNARATGYPNLPQSWRSDALLLQFVSGNHMPEPQRKPLVSPGRAVLVRSREVGDAKTEDGT